MLFVKSRDDSVKSVVPDNIVSLAWSLNSFRESVVFCSIAFFSLDSTSAGGVSRAISMRRFQKGDQA